MSANTNGNPAAMAWLRRMRAAMLRLEAAVVEAADGAGEQPVRDEMARLRAAWAECPLPAHEMGELQVHALINGVWETTTFGG